MRHDTSARGGYVSSVSVATNLQNVRAVRSGVSAGWASLPRRRSFGSGWPFVRMPRRYLGRTRHCNRSQAADDSPAARAVEFQRTGVRRITSSSPFGNGSSRAVLGAGQIVSILEENPGGCHRSEVLGRRRASSERRGRPGRRHQRRAALHADRVEQRTACEHFVLSARARDTSPEQDLRSGASAGMDAPQARRRASASGCSSCRSALRISDYAFCPARIRTGTRCACAPSRQSQSATAQQARRDGRESAPDGEESAQRDGSSRTCFTVRRPTTCVPCAISTRRSPIRRSTCGDSVPRCFAIREQRRTTQSRFSFSRGATPLDIPLGPDYVLGPGDELSINLWGGVIADTHAHHRSRRPHHAARIRRTPGGGTDARQRPRTR